MTAKRLNALLIIGLVVLFFALGASTYFIGNAIKTKSHQLAVDKAQVEQLNTAQASIAKSKRDIASYTQLETITENIVPQDKDQAAAVRELTNIAAACGVTLTTITFPSSSLGTVNAVKGASGSAATTPVTKPGLSQLTPVVGIPGVYNLQITIGNNAANTVLYTQFTSFLRGLENNRRTAAVSSINIQPQSNNPNRLIFTLIINTYIKP